MYIVIGHKFSAVTFEVVWSGFQSSQVYRILIVILTEIVHQTSKQKKKKKGEIFTFLLLRGTLMRQFVSEFNTQNT